MNIVGGTKTAGWSGGLVGGIIGGLGAVANKGNFWAGFMSGALTGAKGGLFIGLASFGLGFLASAIGVSAVGAQIGTGVLLGSYGGYQGYKSGGLVGGLLGFVGYFIGGTLGSAAGFNAYLGAKSAYSAAAAAQQAKPTVAADTALEPPLLDPYLPEEEELGNNRPN